MEIIKGRVRVGEEPLRQALGENYDLSLSDMPDRREGDPFYDDTIPLINGGVSELGVLAVVQEEGAGLREGQ